LKHRDDNWPRAPLELVRCDQCGLLQLRHQTDVDLLCREYWYRSGINQTMRDALGNVVSGALNYAKEGTWLDIGANDGYLLSRVGERFTKIAVEPALNMLPLLEEHADHIIPDYFSAQPIKELTSGADVITSCAMFYHVNEPGQFVADVAQVLSPTGVWINQLSDAPTMLRLNAFDAICHEHACYYTAHDLRTLYAKHGLQIVAVSHNTVNGGSIRIAAMHKKDRVAWSLKGVADTSLDEALAFAERVKRWKELLGNLLVLPPVGNSELWGIGASTKGAVMLQYLGLNDRFVALADRNPAKHGLIAAGSWIPVVNEPTMRAAKPKFALNVLWGFRDEILQREAELRHGGTTIINALPNPEFVL
jgi:2-polyprenyl-3-methyl-5-hydroxy-6-metoxy-1,4-benzoquinol methylase